MKKFLTFIINELNPEHDFDRFRDFVNYNPTDSRTFKPAYKQTRAFGFNTLKHLARGSFIGAITGGLYSYLTNGDLNQSIINGAESGAVIDGLQYWIRGYVIKPH